MLQADRRRILARTGMVWLASVVLLAITCMVQRQRELSGVERELIATRYTAFGETGRHAREAWPTYRHSHAVYLIENGQRNIELMRLLLISEACVVKHDSYLNSYSRNNDLRLHLMEQVLPAYRDDPLVHWAAGVCHMNACRFSEALKELRRALELGLDCEGYGIAREDILIRIMLAAAMEGDPTETMHWVRDTQLGDDLELQAVYADMLCRLYRYDECMEFCQSELEISNNYRLVAALARSQYWTDDYDDIDSTVDRLLIANGELYETTQEYLGDMELQRQAMERRRFIGNMKGRRSLIGNPNVDFYKDSLGYSVWGLNPLKLTGEAWAKFGSQVNRDRLLSSISSNEKKIEEQEHDEIESDFRDVRLLETIIALTYAQLVRAEILRHDWLAATKLLTEYDNSYQAYSTYGLQLELYAMGIDNGDNELPTARFLLGVVNGTDTSELTNHLRDCITIAPFIFHSPEYAAACRDGNRDPYQLQRELIHELAKQHEPDSSAWSGNANYYDNANGELDW